MYFILENTNPFKSFSELSVKPPRILSELSYFLMCTTEQYFELSNYNVLCICCIGRGCLFCLVLFFICLMSKTFLTSCLQSCFLVCFFSVLGLDPLPKSLWSRLQYLVDFSVGQTVRDLCICIWSSEVIFVVLLLQCNSHRWILTLLLSCQNRSGSLCLVLGLPLACPVCQFLLLPPLRTHASWCF